MDLNISIGHSKGFKWEGKNMVGFEFQWSAWHFQIDWEWTWHICSSGHFLPAESSRDVKQVKQKRWKLSQRNCILEQPGLSPHLEKPTLECYKMLGSFLVSHAFNYLLFPLLLCPQPPPTYNTCIWLRIGFEVLNAHWCRIDRLWLLCSFICTVRGSEQNNIQRAMFVKVV